MVHSKRRSIENVRRSRMSRFILTDRTFLTFYLLVSFKVFSLKDYWLDCGYSVFFQKPVQWEFVEKQKFAVSYLWRELYSLVRITIKFFICSLFKFIFSETTGRIPVVKYFFKTCNMPIPKRNRFLLFIPNVIFSWNFGSRFFVIRLFLWKAAGRIADHQCSFQIPKNEKSTEDPESSLFHRCISLFLFITIVLCGVFMKNEGQFLKPFSSCCNQMVPLVTFVAIVFKTQLLCFTIWVFWPQIVLWCSVNVQKRPETFGRYLSVFVLKATIFLKHWCENWTLLS